MQELFMLYRNKLFHNDVCIIAPPQGESMSSTLWRNATLVTMDAQIDGAYGLLARHDVLVKQGVIVDIQPTGRLSAERGSQDDCE